MKFSHNRLQFRAILRGSSAHKRIYRAEFQLAS